MNPNILYPRSNDHYSVYLKNVVNNPFIEVGDFTIYHDFFHNPCEFEKNCVLYHYRYVNNDHLKIGKFCSRSRGSSRLFSTPPTTRSTLL